MNPLRIGRRNLWLITFAATLAPSCGSAIRAQQGNEIFRRVGFEQRLEQQVPLDLSFTDSSGESLTLRQCLHGRPIILTLVYYECPMLCTLELNGLVSSLRTMDFEAGKDFDILTISIAPDEPPQLAAQKRDRYLAQYGRRISPAGWQFLTGDEKNIRSLCEAVGFRYVYDERTDQYAHASGIVVLTPSGQISQYYFGIEYPPRDLRLGLVEASQGRIGSPADHLLLLCYGYDPATGRYGLLIMNIVRLAGAATVAALASFIGVMLYRERQCRKAQIVTSSQQ